MTFSSAYESYPIITFVYSTTVKMQTETGTLEFFVEPGTTLISYDFGGEDEEGMVQVEFFIPLKGMKVLFSGKVHSSLLHVDWENIPKSYLGPVV